MDSEERARREELLRTMEDRRDNADRFAWAVPTVIIASQAFLIPFALDDQTSDGARLFACAAAFVLTAAAGHFFWKQMFAMQLFEAVAKRERRNLRLYQVDRNSLLANARSLDEGFQRQWLARHNGELKSVTKHGTTYYEPRWPIEHKVTHVWKWTIVLVLFANGVLLGWAVWEIVAAGEQAASLWNDYLRPFGNTVSN